MQTGAEPIHGLEKCRYRSSNNPTESSSGCVSKFLVRSRTVLGWVSKPFSSFCRERSMWDDPTIESFLRKSKTGELRRGRRHYDVSSETLTWDYFRLVRHSTRVRVLGSSQLLPHSYNLPLTALLVEVLAEGVETLTKEGGELVYPAHGISERFRM